MSRILAQSFQRYKEAYTGHPIQVWVLAGITLINRLGMMVLPFLTVYLTTVLGFPLRDAGILAGAFGFGSLAGSYLGGRLSDRIGAHNVIGISLLLGGLMFILLQFATTFLPLFLLIFTGAVFGEAYRPAMTAMIGDYVPRSQTGRSMAFIRLAINLGMSLSPALGGFIAVAMGYNWLFWIDGVTCILAAVLFLLLSRNWQAPAPDTVEQVDPTRPVMALKPYKNRSYLGFLLATFITGFVFIQWFHSVPVFIKSEWGFDERYIGMLMAVGSLLIALIEMPIVHAIEKSQKIGAAMPFGLVLIGLSFLPFFWPKSLLLCFVAGTIFTLGEIFFLPFNNAIPLNLSPPGRRGEYMAWYWMAWSLTHITGPSLGLMFIDSFGYAVFWILLIALIALSWLLHRILADRIL